MQDIQEKKSANGIHVGLLNVWVSFPWRIKIAKPIHATNSITLSSE
jgi:hypothetical protein